MQYESVILDLLTRVMKLEEEVRQLSEKLNQLEQLPSESESRSGRAESSSTYQKLTDEQIRLCYQSGKKSPKEKMLPIWRMRLSLPQV